MSSHSREPILGRLRAALEGSGDPAAAPELMTPAPLDRRAKVNALKAAMEAVRTEVHVVSRDHWLETLKGALRRRPLKTLLYAPGTALGQSLEAAWAQDAQTLPELLPYAEEVEHFKESLFQVDAAVTSTLGAIADPGALVLWPDDKEPRLMSLVPPVHIAVLESDRIHDSFAAIMAAQNWSAGMPTNALLISGPSKTADIELTLAFGVHGPKELIVLLIDD